MLSGMLTRQPVGDEWESAIRVGSTRRMTFVGNLRRTLSAVAVVAALAGAGCASNKLDTSALNPDPPSKMFANADAKMSSGSFDDAAKQFEAVDREHPYSPEARKSIVMAAYAYYRAGKTPEAIASAERYVALHPGTKEAPMAHHIIAMSYFDDLKTANRDQTAARKALEQFKILRTRFPESEYSRDADNKIRICMDNLAAQEMEVGRYYLNQHNYVAAINRFKTVVSDYQTTAHVEEALARLVESYMALGVVTEAQNAAAILGHNYPDSKWYKDSYALLQSGGVGPRDDSGSWLSKAWKSVPKFGLGSG
ncbi:outer membrane assembly lipoprotein YfiO [Hyphomicrobium denitrificans ATCC 51888]|uniref:Outer membrane protein assembly factor BamD n=2 Tax=Hyphomicrobium denitrificans TaxID=53399 RepID=D8JQS4_HYPDA|nr:outer membrane assembly lipoprotein YfiO [Hyphomicrobium denitrificans ATCC 51888]